MNEATAAALRAFWLGTPEPAAPTLSPTVAFVSGYAAGRLHAYEEMGIEPPTEERPCSRD